MFPTDATRTALLHLASAYLEWIWLQHQSVLSMFNQRLLKVERCERLESSLMQAARCTIVEVPKLHDPSVWHQLHFDAGARGRCGLGAAATQYTSSAVEYPYCTPGVFTPSCDILSHFAEF